MWLKKGNLFPYGEPQDGGEDERGPTIGYVLMCLVGVALACIGGYFLVMKLIDISRTEDCLLSGRRSCMPINIPLNNR